MSLVHSLRRRFLALRSGGRPQPVHRLRLERLEDRSVPATLPIQSIDGSGNNLLFPDWGSAGIEFLRRSAAAYADGISAPGGDTRPNPRSISNGLVNQPEDTPTNDRDMSAFVYVWGQFIDHDLDLTMSADPVERFNIAIPTGDPLFDPAGTGTQMIPLSRSEYNPTSGTSIEDPREQFNSITAWLDASMIYGSDDETAASLRTFEGGRMKISEEGLLPPEGAGDIRALENPALASLHTLFLREHNRLADQYATEDPTLTDEELYQQARRMVIAEVQSITFNEFLPALLGRAAPGRYVGYRATVNPGITNEFATAGYRIGHTLVGDEIEFLDNNGIAIGPELSLRDAFFNTQVLEQFGIDSVLKYLASDNAQEVDLHIVDGLRNFLFGAPGHGGLDLAALNIQRGRDHGLADYNTVRAAYGLPRVTSFAQITRDRATQRALQDLYGNVNNIDLWIGGLAEDHLRGSSVGPTFARIIADQFQRLRTGDRFWYQNILSRSEQRAVESNTLATIIRNNTGLTNLQSNVFFFKTSLSGRVYSDRNQNDQRDRGELLLPGRTVELIDAAGSVVSTTRTRRDGSYRFDDVPLGNYTVVVRLSRGETATTSATQAVSVTRGGDVTGIDLGEVASLPILGRRSGHPLFLAFDSRTRRNG